MRNYGAQGSRRVQTLNRHKAACPKPPGTAQKTPPSIIFVVSLVAMDHRAAAEQALEGRMRPESAPFAGAVKTSAYDVTARVAGGAITAV